MTRIGKTLTKLMIAAAIAAVTPAGLPSSALAAGSQEAAASRPALPLMLRDRTTVDGDDLLLSHLFANLPAGMDREIGAAPEPGHRLVVGARQLWRYAKSVGLSWRPSHAKQSVVITRASIQIPMDVIADALTARLADEHIAEDFDIDVFGRKSKLFVAANRPLTVTVYAIDYSPRTQRFDATIGVEGSRSVSVAGRVIPIVEVPMLRRHAMPGQVITEEMVAWTRVPARKAGVTTVTQREDIVGHTARRPLTAGVPVRLTDLRPNLLVTKGDLITLMVRTGAMTLTARGEALESGTKGAVIRVRNAQSERVVEARVVGPDMAIIEPATLASLNG